MLHLYHISFYWDRIGICFYIDNVKNILRAKTNRIEIFLLKDWICYNDLLLHYRCVGFFFRPTRKFFKVLTVRNTCTGSIFVIILTALWNRFEIQNECFTRWSSSSFWYVPFKFKKENRVWVSWLLHSPMDMKIVLLQRMALIQLFSEWLLVSCHCKKINFYLPLS